MAKWASFDFSELRRLARAFNKALDDRVIERFMRDFLLEMAFRSERKIKKRTPVDTGHLRRNWKVGTVERQGNALVVEIYNPVDYASFVEYGHRTGKDLTRWVPGRFMATISMQEIERELPRYLERRVMELWDGIMNDRPPRKG